MTCLSAEEIGNVVFVKVLMTLYEKHFSSEMGDDWKLVIPIKFTTNNCKQKYIFMFNGNTYIS